MKNRLCITLLLFISTLFTAPAQPSLEGWKLVVEKENIKVYTRKPKDSAFKEIKIEAIFKTSINQLVAALDDATNYGEWVYKCVSSKQVKRLNELEMYYYIETDFPFPLANRDLVVHSTKWLEKSENAVYYFSTAIDEVVPLNKNLVRIKKYDSFWIIKEIEKNKIKIDYQSRANPAGNLPAWLVNLAVTTGPLKTMEQLEKFIANK